MKALQKSVLITGCSSGIGYDAAHGMRARGWRVFASCRQKKDCDRLKAEGFDSPLIDYSDTATLESGLAEVLSATGGRLDALFNNGAHATPGAVEDLPREALAAIFEVNLFGYHDLTRRVLPVMRAQSHGRIVNCSSILGLVGAKWRGAYVATKFAMEGLSDVLRIEMMGTGIDIILIEPGPITSDIRKNSIPHFERWIDVAASPRAAEYAALHHRLYDKREPDRYELPASAVTAKLVHALESKRPKARYYVTTPTWVVGNIRRFLPTRALDWFIRRG